MAQSRDLFRGAASLAHSRRPTTIMGLPEGGTLPLDAKSDMNDE